MREAYRLQKHELYTQLQQKNIFLDLFFIYVGKELPDYDTVFESFNQSLKKLQKWYL